MNATLQERVQQVIDGLVASGDEIGLQVAAYVNDDLVVDAWSGVATCLHILADCGQEAPAAPETNELSLASISEKGKTMRELMIDFITSLDGYASGEGWPGWWGLEGPEYFAWLGEQPPVTYLMGANTYRQMSGFAGEKTSGTAEFPPQEEASFDKLTQAPKVVFSATLEGPLTWANTTLVHGDAVQAVRAMKEEGEGILSTLGSLSLCRSLLRAGIVDRFRVVMFPVITGATGAERIYDGYPDVALTMIDHRTFDGRLQLVEYRPRVLEGPPLPPTA